ncbi:hypothetical protein HNS38_16330 [Lentimicrobium sp. L6]|uniref:hypothetical protein n=1 Tax=Lentimicrobium sp. L6 TaxID=2735916 RepID=UPI0015533558|nr:hypothetical protein [Lentimicrobium sp. L6]NPD86342.1 hypothetical protein [Lentimicrobium sp. L6]
MMLERKYMKSKWLNYGLIFLLSFILFGNTLRHQYALDDAIVITENEYVLNGIDGIPEIFSQELFNGFFDEKNKDLVAGGRYRPVSLLTFAMEYEFIMGSPFEGLDELDLEKRLNQNHSNKNQISPFQKLNKELNKTLITLKDSDLEKGQNLILDKYQIRDKERKVIIERLRIMKGKQPAHQFISHTVNVLFFAFTGLILFMVLSLMFRDDSNSVFQAWLPFFITLLFISHPIHTEVVANIKGRDEIIAFFMSLWALYLSFKYVDTQKIKYLFGSFWVFLVAVFSKEVAVTFIAIIPLAIWFFRGGKWKEMGVSILPVLLASFVYLLIRALYVEGIASIGVHESTEIMNNSFYGMDVMTKYATILYSLLLYLKLLIFPHPLTYDYYPYHIAAQSWDFWPIFSVVVYLSLAVYAIFGLFKRHKIAFGVIFFAISLAPTSNILFSIGAFMNERFIYGASLGFSIITGYLILVKLPLVLKNENLKNYLVFGLLFTIIGLYSFKTIDRNRAWENDFVLMTTDVKTSSNSAKSNCSAAGKLIEYAMDLEDKPQRNQNLNQAIEYLHQAIRIHPSYVDALILMGNAQFWLSKNLDSTFYYYHQVLQLSPNNQIVQDNLFQSRIKLEYDNPQQSMSLINGLELVYPYLKDKWQTNYFLGRTYGRYQNNLHKAIEYLSIAKKQNPNSIEVLEDLGVAFGISGNFEGSSHCFMQALEIDPKSTNLKFNAVNLLLQTGDRQKAKDLCQQLLDEFLKKNNKSGLQKLAYIYQDIGEQELADIALKKSIE